MQLYIPFIIFIYTFSKMKNLRKRVSSLRLRICKNANQDIIYADTVRTRIQVNVSWWGSTYYFSPFILQQNCNFLSSNQNHCINIAVYSPQEHPVSSPTDIHGCIKIFTILTNLHVGMYLGLFLKINLVVLDVASSNFNQVGMVGATVNFTGV